MSFGHFRTSGGIFLLGVLCATWAFVIVGAPPALSFDGTLTAGNLLQASTTVAVALIVAWYLQPKGAIDRKEKDILLNLLNLAIDGLADLELRSENGVLIEINASCKKISITCRSVLSLLRSLQYPDSILCALSVESDILELRGLVGEGGGLTSGAAMDSTVVVDGKIALSPQRQLLVSSKLQQLRIRLLQGAVRVNRA
jgi:hypothetical protein